MFTPKYTRQETYKALSCHCKPIDFGRGCDGCPLLSCGECVSSLLDHLYYYLEV